MTRRRTSLAGYLLAWAPLLVISAAPAAAQNGVILDQQLNGDGQGYTVLRVWGSHHEMGSAHASLMGDFIVDAVNETKDLLGPVLYSTLRQIMAEALWMPAEIEDELAGMVGSLAITHPSADIDHLDLKVANTYGDWNYACRSHTCWGRYVAAPVETLSTRRLDYGSPVPSAGHHVLCAWDPADGSPQWVNLGWAGGVAAVSAVNEFGTLVSLHDYQSQGADLTAQRMPRCVAARYALSFATDPDLSTHLDEVFAELQQYEIMTGSFVNYYAPQGHGGVMVCNPYQAGADFYYLRRPHPDWHHGEAMITTNAWTDGSYTPPDENFGADAYYDDESPKTLESHWDLLADTGNGLHMLSVAYRERGDMTIWADGRLSGGGRTPRLEWEWSELLGVSDCPGDLNGDGFRNLTDFTIFAEAYGSQIGQPNYNPDADFDGDGFVNITDFTVFAGYYLVPCP